MPISTIFVMISTTAKYALRAVVYLADNADGFANRSLIADATMVPHDYLLKVLNELDDAGIVDSRRGPGGGYRLTRKPAQITALEVVLAVDEIPRISECPIGLSDHHELCPLHKLLDDASRLVEEAFARSTIADLLPRRRKRTPSCDFPTTKT